ncbi:hypothetical protein EYF80_052854 [Liparis tanakae]|uniref:Uncharacterized protein n=1 Tax=Liparis tanakae TaxID=230148 RepID=A0A4Z2F7Y3_9TELE|nr:hypothetical protein EYF80_052854 [Liparis tanakae]
MSLNLVMKACLMMSTATSEVTTMKTSGNSTHSCISTTLVLRVNGEEGNGEEGNGEEGNGEEGNGLEYKESDWGNK